MDTMNFSVTWSTLKEVDDEEKMTTELESSSSSRNLTVNEIMELYCSGAILIDRVVTPIWYLIGIIGNIISAKIWLERRMRRNNSSAIYLAALSINDTLFLLLHMVQELKYAWFMRTVDYPVVCGAYALVYLVTNYLAPALVLGFTVERFIAVCYPYQKMRYCTANRATKVVIGLVCGCFLLGGIQPYFWEYDPIKRECTISSDYVRYWANWSWATEMIIFLVVPVVILIINILVMLEVRRISGPLEGQSLSFHESFRFNFTNSHHHHSNKSPSISADSHHSAMSRRGTVNSASTVQRNHCVATTNAMLLSVSFYVIFTTLPATVVYVLIYAFDEGDMSLPVDQIPNDPVWTKHFVYIMIRKIVDEICLSHYACNFFLFTITGKMFRESFMSLVRCGSKSASSKSEQSTKYYTIHRTENGLDHNNVIITKL